RDNHSAYTFIKQYGKPQMRVINQAPSSRKSKSKVNKDVKLTPSYHSSTKYLKNLIKQVHRHIKVRKIRYQSIKTA
ncbi:hypothetical protein EX86_15055, partial [Staphylococcus aureus]